MEKRRKVLFLITKSNFGGAQRYVFDLASNLPQREFDVVVAAGGEGLLFEKLRAKGVRTVTLPNLDRDVHPLNDLQSFRDIRQLLRDEAPDILHLNSSKIGGLGALAGRLERVPRIIFTAHGLAFAEDRSFLSKFLIRCIYWVTIRLAHTTIAVSATIASALAMRGLAGKITTIHNGITPAEALSHDDARHVLAEGRPLMATTGWWIGTIAELHPIKGLRYAIEAMNILHDRGVPATFVIIGEGDERLKLERLIAERNLGEIVYLAGFVPDAEKYVRACDICTMSSLHEGLNYAVLEAGAAGVPVVASATGGIPEIVHEPSALVPARDSRAIADAIEKMIRDSAARENAGARLQERINADFSLETMLAKTKKLYVE